jgi:nucleoside-diphosphate-sugar epimerase
MLYFPLHYKSSKRILVTSGSGFLGSYLCEKLLALDHEIICVESFFMGYKSNISHLLGNGSSSSEFYTNLFCCKKLSLDSENLFSLRGSIWHGKERCEKT